MEAVAAWRERAERACGVGRGRRFPTEMQVEALVLVARAERAGSSTRAACEQLGIPIVTLRRWQRAHAGFREVKIVEDSASTIELHIGPSLARLTVPQLAELLRALA